MSDKAPEQTQKADILLIDDDPSQLESLANLFELDGLNPICCLTAANALKVCKEQTVSVAILDLRMPDINGIDLLKLLKKFNPNIKVIIHTAYATVESAAAAVNEEAFAYIQKLGNVGELISHVHRAFYAYFIEYNDALEAAVKKTEQDLVEANKILRQKVSEGMKREQAIQEMQFALTNAMPGMSKLDSAGQYVTVNPYYTSMLDYKEQELIGRNWESIIHPDDHAQATQAYQQMQVDGKAELEARVLRKDGSEFYQQALMIKIADPKGIFNGHHCFMRDISERKQAEEKLNYQASHDSLTGLINRREFEFYAEHLFVAIRASESGNDSGHALCYLDLDQFKVINDTCGHVAGDRMLQQVARIMQDTVRKHDTLARLGGDEFGIIMEHCSLENAYEISQNLLDAVRSYQFVWEGCIFRVGVSIGLVEMTDKTPSLSELLKQADIACYMAKDKGRNRIHYYHSGDVELAKHRDEMLSVGQIYQSLKEDRFSLFLQLVQPLKDTRGKHYEVLIRMEYEKGTIIPPSEFLPAAERYNIISSLDRWVINKTCELLVENSGFVEQVNFIAINISGQSLSDETFLDYVSTRIKDSGIHGSKFCFEITETAVISNLNQAREFIAALRKIGCRFSLDDFGSGLSSYGYLKNLPADYLKIDGMFVRDMLNDPIDRAVVRSINNIGHELGMQIVAEFVESTEIRDMLEEMGVDYVQGRGIHKPQPFVELLEQQREVVTELI